MTAIAADGPLPLARRRLDDAVHALADPAPVWVGGVCRWSDAVYVRLRMALCGSTPVTRGRVWQSKMPCRSDVLSLLCQIDTTVGGWEPHGKGTVDRLHLVAGRGFRPQDCEVIGDYCDRLERWTVSAAGLLTPELRVFLREPCPRCSALFTYRRNGADECVRVRVLRVSESGCTCQACGAFWEPAQFEWLARLLGCPALPA